MINKTFWHLCAYAASVTNGVTNFDVAAVADQVFTKNSGGHFLLPEQGRLRFAYGAGTDLDRFRVNTPALRYVGLPFLNPVNITAATPSPYNIWNPGEQGPTIPVADEVAVEATQTNAAAQECQFLLGFSFGKQEIAPGPEYSIRFTATITGVDNSWASGSMTPDSTLPAGIYAINGMHAWGTNLTAARLIFPGGGWRPGCIANNTTGGIPREIFRNGELGQYGQFDSVNVPNLEILCSGANTAQTVYLDLVRVGNR